MADRLEHLSAVDPRDDPEKLVAAIESEVPSRPYGWDKSEPRTLPPHMAAEPLFVCIAKAARAQGKGYLIDHLWEVFDAAKNVLAPWHEHKQRKEMEQARKRREAECG